MTGEVSFVRVRRAHLLVVGVVLLCCVPTPTMGAPSTEPAEPSTVTHPAMDVGSLAPTNNSTIRHEHPDEVDQSGDLERLNAFLTDRLTDQLRQSSIHLQQGEYERAREYIGEEYRSLLDRYVEVEGETTGDDNRSEAFNSARETQTTLISSAEQYHETHRQYQEAKRRGNTAQARSLARELEALSRTVNETGTAVLEKTGRATNETGSDLTTVETVTRSVTKNVTGLQGSVRAAEFIETRLTVRAPPAETSFLTPLGLAGQITTANGSVVANRSVHIQVADRILATTTNESGWFRVSYRPTTLRLGATETTVRYAPRSDSIYLGSVATIGVNITQVRPALALSTAPESVAYGASPTISGHLSAGEVDVPAVPVVVSIGGQRIGTTRTNATGAFVVNVSIPATIPAGERTVRAALPLDGQALASTNVTTSVQVRETPTHLSVDGDSAGSQANVSGRLTTDNGTALADQRIEIHVADSSVTTRTDEAGRYVTQLALSRGAREEPNVSVAVVFDGTGTNLAPARASATLEWEVEDGEASPSLVAGAVQAVSSAPPAALVGAGLGLASLGFVLLRRRSTAAAEATDSASGTALGEVVTSQTSPSDGRSSRRPATVARELLGNDEPERAVRVAFASARERLTQPLELTPGSTHWELYNACKTTGRPDGQVEAIHELVVAFERATFAASDTPTEVAESAIDALDRLFDE